MSVQEANVVRWTPARIRKALLCPKPQGAVARAYAIPRGVTAADVKLLRWIAAHADLLDLPVPRYDPAAPINQAEGWLLVPAPRWLIEGLAHFEGEAEEFEADHDNEPDADGEAGAEDEPETDEEPGLVYPHSMSRRGLEDESGLVVSAERRARYQRSSEGEPLRAVKRQLKVWAAER